MEIPSACLESLSYSSSENTDIVKYIKREIIKPCRKCYNGSEEQVRKNREEPSCQKSGHMVLTKLPTPEAVLLSLELQVINLPTLCSWIS